MTQRVITRNTSCYLSDAPGIEHFYNVVVKTGNIEKKTNQATVYPNIMIYLISI